MIDLAPYYNNDPEAMAWPVWPASLLRHTVCQSGNSVENHQKPMPFRKVSENIKVSHVAPGWRLEPRIHGELEIPWMFWTTRFR